MLKLWPKNLKDPGQRSQIADRKLNNETLAKLKGEDKISDSLYEKLWSANDLPPRFYGLRKVHKLVGYPLQPTVSFVNSPTYMLLKHLAQTLKPLIGKNQFHT